MLTVVNVTVYFVTFSHGPTKVSYGCENLRIDLKDMIELLPQEKSLVLLLG